MANQNQKEYKKTAPVLSGAEHSFDRFIKNFITIIISPKSHNDQFDQGRD